MLPLVSTKKMALLRMLATVCRCKMVAREVRSSGFRAHGKLGHSGCWFDPNRASEWSACLPTTVASLVLVVPNPCSLPELRSQHLYCFSSHKSEFRSGCLSRSWSDRVEMVEGTGRHSSANTRPVRTNRADRGAWPLLAKFKILKLSH